MKLTEYDKKLLSGEYGEAKKIAMEKTIELAKILGTDELVTVTKAHCCIGALDEFTRADSDLDHVYSTMYLGKDMKLDPMSELCH